jgi:hypothetical protein
MYKLLLAVVSLPFLLPAATIMSDGTPEPGTPTGQSVAAGFNLTSTWTNVQIELQVATQIGGAGSSITAFLTSQLGTGTNASHNVQAPVVIVVPPGNSTQILFSGLTLGPGNYFFSLNPADGQTGAIVGGTGVVTTAPTVNSLGVYTLPTAPSGLASPTTLGLHFTVTGDEEIPGVPEPSTFALLSLGVAGMVTVYRKRN